MAYWEIELNTKLPFGVSTQFTNISLTYTGAVNITLSLIHPNGAGRGVYLVEYNYISGTKIVLPVMPYSVRLQIRYSQLPGQQMRVTDISFDGIPYHGIPE